ncbi:MAG: hypothetical protein ACLFR7_11060 [Opitutales bacterium]
MAGFGGGRERPVRNAMAEKALEFAGGGVELLGDLVELVGAGGLGGAQSEGPDLVGDDGDARLGLTRSFQPPWVGARRTGKGPICAFSDMRMVASSSACWKASRS